MRKNSLKNNVFEGKITETGALAALRQVKMTKVQVQMVLLQNFKNVFWNNDNNNNNENL